MFPVTGQCSSVEDDEWSNKCHKHPNTLATHRLCVAADSFGEEYSNMCDHCWHEYQKALKQKAEDPDQWDTCPECKGKAPCLISYRDMDEGTHGPVYEHCESCHTKMNKRIEEEEQLWDNDHDDYIPEPVGWDDEDDEPYLHQQASIQCYVAVQKIVNKLGYKFSIEPNKRGDGRNLIGEIKPNEIPKFIKRFKKALFEAKAFTIGASMVTISSQGLMHGEKEVCPDLSVFGYHASHEYTYITLSHWVKENRGLFGQLKPLPKDAPHIVSICMGSSNQPA